MKRSALQFAAAVYLAVITQCALGQDNVATHWNANVKNDIFKVGRFDEDGAVPKGWKNVSAFDSGYATLNPRGRGTLSINVKTEKEDAYIETQVEVPASAKYLTLMVAQRGPTLKKSSQPESGAGVRFTLLKGDQEWSLNRVEPRYDGYRNWANSIQTIQVMPGENKLRIRVEVTKAIGSLEIDNIFVVPSEIANEATADQQRLLEQAIKSDDADLMKELVEANRHLLEVRTGVGDNGTPLIRAAWDGAPKVAAMLIKLGADVEAKDSNWGNTPLRWCCWWGNPEVADILMEAGAEAVGASEMARSSKMNNTFTKRLPEDFDRTAKIIEGHLAKRKPRK